MSHSEAEAPDYETPRVPPSTPPVVNDKADAEEAAAAPVDGDSDEPGKHPDEIQPDQGDHDEPASAPDEVNPGGGDIDQPGATPDEAPPQPGTQPMETPPPPD